MLLGSEERDDDDDDDVQMENPWADANPGSLPSFKKVSHTQRT